MDRNDTLLVLRDIPVFGWMIGIVFTGVGAAIFFSGEPGSNAGLIFAAIGVPFLLFCSVLTITADRVTRTLTLNYRSVLLHSRKEFSFNDIVGIGVERVSGRKPTFHVVLKCKDGKVIPFRSSSSSGSRKKIEQAQTIRNFIGVPDFDSSPAGMAYAALQSYIDNTQETNGVHWQIQAKGSARWHSPDFRTSGVFLAVVQKAGGQSSHGFMASLGSRLFIQMLSSQFRPDDLPGIDRATLLDPLDHSIDAEFMAFTNDPTSAGRILNSRMTAVLADWARRYPLKMLQKPSGFGQLTVLIGPNGIYASSMNLLKPEQVGELTALGTELVRSQNYSQARSASAI